MAYGTIKVDTITFTDSGVDKSVSISGLVQNPTFSGNITVTGTVSGNTIQGQTVSGVTVTGTTANFTSGNFTTFTGGTITLTSGVIASGTAANPSLSILGDANTGLYSPGADQLAISTSGTQRLVVDAGGNVGIGTTSPAARVHSDWNSGVQFRASNGFATFDILNDSTNSQLISSGPLFYRTGASSPHIFQYNNGSNEALRIDGSGRVGIGTSSPNSILSVSSGLKAANNNYLFLETTDASNKLQLKTSNVANTAWSIQSEEAGIAYRALALNPSGGNVGIGTTSPGFILDTSQSSNGDAAVNITNANTGTGAIAQFRASNGTASAFYGIGGTNYTSYAQIRPSGAAIYTGSAAGIGLSADNASGYISFGTGAGALEKARLTPSGQLLVGTSSARAIDYWGTPRQQFEGVSYEQAGLLLYTNSAGDAFGTYLALGKSRGSVTGSNTIVQANDELGHILFYGSDGSNEIRGAQITAFVDGTPGANDMPGRLVFSTTADGASSPTERMRITSDGNILFNTTSASFGGTTSFCGAVGALGTSAFFAQGYQEPVMEINRQGDDGVLISFYQDIVAEGSISVSGTTVSYNGAHLSRWSQLPSGIERTEILRGSVLSNIDEMCEWGDENNEQLNRMKVSDVEGDKNVSGVFQSWDDDDDTYTNDFYCAMTGDFVIRIGAGVTVGRGDLLMSAGDGTAKPQDDDIIRSKTVAKVTSTNVSCTYDDGSYCVPCVLMAC